MATIKRQQSVGCIPATHNGVISLGEVQIPCHVLADGRRVLSRNGAIEALGMSKGAGSTRGERIAVFLGGNRLKPFVPAELQEVRRFAVEFKAASGQNANGYLATMLPDVCDVVLAARAAGVLQPQQLHIAAQCELIVRGLARVGIIALIDEATGYQVSRAEGELARQLEAFITREQAAWAKTFPDEYYRQMYRLRGTTPPACRNHPLYFGHLTNDVVYSRLAPAVLDALQHVNPTDDAGHRRARHHQFLTEDIGRRKLGDHLTGVVTLMRVSRDWDHFKAMIDHIYPAYRATMPLPFAVVGDIA